MPSYVDVIVTGAQLIHFHLLSFWGFLLTLNTYSSVLEFIMLINNMKV